MKILKTENKKDERFLRTPVPELNWTPEAGRELRKVAREMRRAMKEAEGIGLAANQVGLAERLFIAELPDKDGGRKFYAVLNPMIVRKSETLVLAEEGCLSIPGIYGLVSRHREITLGGLSLTGKKLKIKAWGLLARVFQHELDHLDGVLFTDKATEVYKREVVNPL